MTNDCLCLQCIQWSGQIELFNTSIISDTFCFLWEPFSVRYWSIRWKESFVLFWHKASHHQNHMKTVEWRVLCPQVYFLTWGVQHIFCKAQFHLFDLWANTSATPFIKIIIYLGATSQGSVDICFRKAIWSGQILIVGTRTWFAMFLLLHQ